MNRTSHFDKPKMRLFDEKTPLPRIDRWLMGGFERSFLPRYLRKHFHALAINREQLSDCDITRQDSLVVYANHASWWDPMTAIYVRSRLFAQHAMYAPIDSQSLARYRIFNRMGFFGVAKDQRRGAVEFLRSSLRIASHPAASIWVTPEGRFCDVRDVQQPLMPGLAHLAVAIEKTALTANIHSSRVWFVPIAVEYVFWEERLPECLCWIGSPVLVQWGKPTAHKLAWGNRLTSILREAQRSLASASVARDVSKFETLLHGRTGSWGIYDAARRMLSRIRGEDISMEHGVKLTQAKT